MKCKEAGIKIHPARFPAALPEIFIKLLTDHDDVVLDPFAGSNTTGMVAEALGRSWIAMDAVAEYLEASKFRFSGSVREPVKAVTKSAEKRARRSRPRATQSQK
jgi:site-specific DNA-methyltransferase (cytosine-N4-specific)